ncbi:hypothetical protein A2947_01375 [Candidatus Peribacteria bacterium RIFCSPLOWO2_01_FULL_54_110]|nr:MAG: hypothetical protein A2947_01375 [Candidatus Peribacteria bacterium RIFCSPLOWO2_01_FULL_54_110]
MGKIAVCDGIIAIALRDERKNPVPAFAQVGQTTTDLRKERPNGLPMPIPAMAVGNDTGLVGFPETESFRRLHLMAPDFSPYNFFL